jgi:alkaline phosphatase D
VAPPCAEYDEPRTFLGRKQMNWLKRRLSASKATWKVVGSQTMMMPAKVTGGSYFAFDSWQGYPQEREELLAHIKDEGIDDVVFITGDIHTFIAGDVRTLGGAGPSVAVELVGGSITSRGIGEGEAGLLPGNDRNPATSPGVLGLLRAANPWVDQADLDHHGYARVTATQQRLDCELVRMATIKRRSRAKLPSSGFTYSIARGQTSIKGVNGPAA